MKTAHRQLLVDLLTLPTSPFNEQHVIRYIAEWAAKRPGLLLSQDRFGNLQIRLRRAREASVRQAMGRMPVPRTGETPVPHPTGGVPLVLAAHMDHPGFEAERMVRHGVVRAIWRGGVAPEYFPGTKVRFHAGGKWVRGRIERMKAGEDDRGRRRVQWAEASVGSDVPGGAIGMWDFPDPVIRETRLHARGCDDVAGVAAVLAALDVLAEREEPVDVIAMLSRAEEVGFAGAMAACRDGLIPRTARMISVECSSELAGGRMGDGPILRVGDATSIFTPELTAFCRRVGETLAARSRRFRFQRKLMDGGTCEASAFLGYGYQAAGLCIALGNYHNMDRRRGRIGAEYVDLNDWNGLVEWFVELAIANETYEPGHGQLTGLLDGLYARWTPVLEETVERVRLAPAAAPGGGHPARPGGKEGC